MTEHEKKFVQLGKIYLGLLHLKSVYESDGNKPPDDLLNEIKDLERQVRDLL